MDEFKPCPFCGVTLIGTTDEEVFTRAETMNSKAAIRCFCYGCGAEIWDFSFGEHDYDKRVNILKMKWNARA